MNLYGTVSYEKIVYSNGKNYSYWFLKIFSCHSLEKLFGTTECLMSLLCNKLFHQAMKEKRRKSFNHEKLIAQEFQVFILSPWW
jgi:hypothetical protein